MTYNVLMGTLNPTHSLTLSDKMGPSHHTFKGHSGHQNWQTNRYLIQIQVPVTSY